MLLIDFNPLIISAVHVAQNNIDSPDELNVDFVRHLFLNQILNYKKQFNQYGQVVLCCDAKNSWRKEVYPYYKATRKKSREDSPINWQIVFESIDTIKQEMNETFPYKVVSVDRAEADDIIAVLVKYTQTHELHGSIFEETPQPVMIVSADKDFRQLQIYRNVEQFSPLQQRSIVESRPDLYLQEHIIRGDTNDGVPNIFSDDDVFMVAEKRQKPIRQTKLDEWLENPESFEKELQSEITLRNYHRNKKMVDLISEIPEDIEDEIVKAYISAPAEKNDIFGYFIRNRLKNLMQDMPFF